MEQHRNSLGQPFGAGHAPGFGNEEIGSLHQLVDFPGKSEQVDMLMDITRILLHLLQRLGVAAEAENDLDLVPV
ncbi:hypothetical protein D3C81_1847070 [compost metagenome]